MANAKVSQKRIERLILLATKLNIDWKPESVGWNPNEGCKIFNDPIFGVRLCYQSIKVGTSTFCLMACEPVSSKDITIHNKPMSLWTFQTPKEVKDLYPNVPPFWLLPVSKTEGFYSYDYNPIPIQNESEVENYLEGWS